MDRQAFSGGEPDAAEMALINGYAKRPLTGEEVYCFSVKLCDNDIDRDFERFSDEALHQMAALFLGRTGLLDHHWSAKEQVARLFSVKVAAEEGRTTADGRPYLYLKGRAYMLRGGGRDALIRDIEGGIKREVSVGLSCAETRCSVCGGVWGGCGHVKGTVADGKVCHAVLSQPSDAYEWSFVAVPAQKAAGVMKAHSDNKGEGEEMHESLSKDQAVLEREAAWGRMFVKNLREEVVRLGGLCALPRDALTQMAGQMDCDALISVRDALKGAAEKRYPKGPQLPYGQEQPIGRATPEYKI